MTGLFAFAWGLRGAVSSMWGRASLFFWALFGLVQDAQYSESTPMSRVREHALSLVT